VCSEIGRHKQFCNAIAEKLGVPVKETKVGFKNFRPYLLQTSPERAIVAFEESDGISGYNILYEKTPCSAASCHWMMAGHRQESRRISQGIMDEFGYYYPDGSRRFPWTCSLV